MHQGARSWLRRTYSLSQRDAKRDSSSSPQMRTPHFRARQARTLTYLKRTLRLAGLEVCDFPQQYSHYTFGNVLEEVCLELARRHL